MIDFEALNMLNGAPKRFNVAKCLSNDRTFPYNKASPRAKLANQKGLTSSGLQSSLETSTTRQGSLEVKKPRKGISAKSGRNTGIPLNVGSIKPSALDNRRKQIVSIIDSHQGGIMTGRTAAESNTIRGIEQSVDNSTKNQT